MYFYELFEGFSVDFGGFWGLFGGFSGAKIHRKLEPTFRTIANLVAEQTSFPISDLFLRIGGGSNLIQLTKDIVNMSLNLINHQYGKTPEEIQLNNHDFQHKQFDFIRQHPDYHLIQNIDELYDNNDFQEYLQMILNGEMQCFNKLDHSYNFGYTDIEDQVRILQRRMNDLENDGNFGSMNDDFTTSSTTTSNQSDDTDDYDDYVNYEDLLSLFCEDFGQKNEENDKNYSYYSDYVS